MDGTTTKEKQPQIKNSINTVNRVTLKFINISIFFIFGETIKKYYESIKKVL
jgi:hypothetical protein